MALTGYGEESYGLCSVLGRGCAEGLRSFPEGLGVSPNSLFSPKSRQRSSAYLTGVRGCPSVPSSYPPRVWGAKGG
jgi:hypothetical protein